MYFYVACNCVVTRWLCKRLCDGQWVRDSCGLGGDGGGGGGVGLEGYLGTKVRWVGRPRCVEAMVCGIAHLCGAVIYLDRYQNIEGLLL